MLSQRAWTWIAPAVLCTIDVGVTLALQPDTYWREGYRFGHEFNPLARWLLQAHPAALVAGGLLWVLFFSAVLARLPLRTARLVALVLVFAHAFGASTWLIRHPPYGWLACFGVWLLARWLFGRFWDGPRQAAVKPAAPQKADR